MSVWYMSAMFWIQMMTVAVSRSDTGSVAMKPGTNTVVCVSRLRYLLINDPHC